jgi:hypothetical protein
MFTDARLPPSDILGENITPPSSLTEVRGIKNQNQHLGLIFEAILTRSPFRGKGDSISPYLPMSDFCIYPQSGIPQGLKGLILGKEPFKRTLVQDSPVGRRPEPAQPEVT